MLAVVMEYEMQDTRQWVGGLADFIDQLYVRAFDRPPAEVAQDICVELCKRRPELGKTLTEDVVAKARAENAEKVGQVAVVSREPTMKMKTREWEMDAGAAPHLQGITVRTTEKGTLEITHTQAIRQTMCGCIPMPGELWNVDIPFGKVKNIAIKERGKSMRADEATTMGMMVVPKNRKVVVVYSHYLRVGGGIQNQKTSAIYAVMFWLIFKHNNEPEEFRELIKGY